MRSPLLDLARESLAGDHAAGVDILYPLMNLVEYKEPIDDLIEGGVIGQAFDGLDGLLFGGVGVHWFSCADYRAVCGNAVSSISMTKRCLARGSRWMSSICCCNFGAGPRLAGFARLSLGFARRLKIVRMPSMADEVSTDVVTVRSRTSRSRRQGFVEVSFELIA